MKLNVNAKTYVDRSSKVKAASFSFFIKFRALGIFRNLIRIKAPMLQLFFSTSGPLHMPFPLPRTLFLVLHVFSSSGFNYNVASSMRQSSLSEMAVLCATYPFVRLLHNCNTRIRSVNVPVFVFMTYSYLSPGTEAPRHWEISLCCSPQNPQCIEGGLGQSKCSKSS